MKPKSRKAKDLHLFNNVRHLLSDAVFWNNSLYPKNPITKQDLINEINRQTEDGKLS